MIILKRYNYSKKNNEEMEIINSFYIEEKVQNSSSSKKEINAREKLDYIAIVNIPKINLRRGLVNKNSKYNDINTNIQILKESDMPDILNGNFILAAHSGDSNISYFKNIDKLISDDLVYIDYDKLRYEYKVVNFYTVEKTGQVEIVRNVNKNGLTLITCVDGTNKQLIIICELSSVYNLH